MSAAVSRPMVVCPPASADAGLRHVAAYQVGVIPLTFRTNCADAARRFDWAYGPYRVAEVQPGSVVLEAIRSGSRWRGDLRFDLLSNGVLRSTIRRAGDLLPYLDWAGNWAVGLGRPEYLQVHAACVSRDGAGTILAGAPESGKTTLSAALCLSGWHYLCDEFALIDPHSAMLQPYPKALSIKQPSFALLRRWRRSLPLGRALAMREGRRVASLPAHQIRPDAVGAACPVRMVVFPRVDTAASPSLRPISAAEALFRLNRLSFNFLDYRAAGIELFERIVRAARCYEMISGDLRASVALLNNAMDESTRRAGP